ncbi:MAG: universal stress protein [Solirubrobacterales bacterium]|nr:universal stress protein [Solirubrobacterales bacterium]MBV9945038.1 universal stress protein [Solirubrobacterales bacterium]
MFRKVVWATDGSDAADRALSVARQLAAEVDGEVLAVHCVELTMPGKGGGRFSVYANEDELEEKIERQLRDLKAAGVPARMRMARAAVGEAAHVIAEAAQEEGGDVIVVGTRGRSPLIGALLGSVTQRLLHVAPCPVLAVPTRNGDRSD